MLGVREYLPTVWLVPLVRAVSSRARDIRQLYSKMKSVRDR